MSKFTIGQDVNLHIPSIEAAAQSGIHLIDDSKVCAKVVYVNEEDKTVNLVVIDHVGTNVALTNVSSVKPKDEGQMYVTALTK